MTQAVVIKSKSYGIHLVLNPEMEFHDLTQAVIAKFKEAGDFFKNAQIGISFEGYDLTMEQEYELIAAIESYTSVNIICIMEDNEIQQACLLAETESYIRNKVAKNAIFHYGSLKPGEELHSDTGLVIYSGIIYRYRTVTNCKYPVDYTGKRGERETQKRISPQKKAGGTDTTDSACQGRACHNGTLYKRFILTIRNKSGGFIVCVKLL